MKGFLKWSVNNAKRMSLIDPEKILKKLFEEDNKKGVKK